MCMIKSGDKEIYIYGEKSETAPLIIVNTFEGDGSGIYSELKKLTGAVCTLCVVSGVNWDDELSPWESPAAYKNGSPFTGGADAYLYKLTGQIIPDIVKKVQIEPEYMAIAGYSLAGLFSLYSLYKTDIFSRAVSASGSLWFPGFYEFVQKNDFLKKPDKVYFSLGDKEAKTKNALLCTVQDKTEQIFELYKKRDVKAAFELNSGNHFRDADLRLAKGIAAIL